jgi:hypothetical protein
MFVDVSLCEREERLNNEEVAEGGCECDCESDGKEQKDTDIWVAKAL